MINLTIREIIKYLAILYFAVIAFMFLSVSNEWIANQNTDINIKKEVHIANLLGQYNSDLNACLEEAKTSIQLNEDICIKTMNESHLAELIISWGYEDALTKTPGN